METIATTDGLVRRFRGQLIHPGDDAFDDARRVWNGMIDRHPALVARCVSADDVRASLDFARRRGLPVTVRGGGHSVAGHAVADDAVVVDCTGMTAVQVDSTSMIARVEPGVTWGRLDQRTQRHGLAVTGGVDSRTGIAGLTLGGGVGYRARAHGLTIDSLVSADVVLADGRLVSASERELSDLFWAIRGGGGNFGIVTSFEYRLHRVGPGVMTAQVFYPMDQAVHVLTRYRDFVAEAPDEVGCYALFVNAPPLEALPAEVHGRTVLVLVACHAGSLDAGAAALSPLGRFGRPLVASIAPMPYATLQQSFDTSTPDGGRYYWKAAYLSDLADEAVETLVDRVDPLPGPFSNVFIESMGGAVARVDPAATAFPHRHARFGFGISSGWHDPTDDESVIAWTRDLHAAMSAFSTGGVYANYLDRDDEEPAQAAFRTNHARLCEVKASYDPDNRFHFNVNVLPAR